MYTSSRLGNHGFSGRVKTSVHKKGKKVVSSKRASKHYKRRNTEAAILLCIEGGIFFLSLLLKS